VESVTIKLGIIGLSEGNGHPYSWSAIFNGYNSIAMEECGYPVIPRYLEQQAWPDSQIKNAEVVAVWTQDSCLSHHIAQSSRIRYVVDYYEDMIGKVDAILLARDDAQNHLRYAEPFLKAGLPIYIDKPIALSLEDLEKLYALEQYPGQIFTCSALRFSQELMLTEEDTQKIGKIKQITAFTPKSWKKYAVHIIEPVLNMLPVYDVPVETLSPTVKDETGTLVVRWKSGIQTNFFALGEGVSPLSIRVCGTEGFVDLTFTDSFSAFKDALQAFVNGISIEKIASKKSFNKQVVQLLESGI
jgi:hypothetical protein